MAKKVLDSTSSIHLKQILYGIGKHSMHTQTIRHTYKIMKYIYMYNAHTHTHTHTYTHIHRHTHNTHTYTETYISTHTCTHAHLLICIVKSSTYHIKRLRILSSTKFSRVVKGS